MKTYSKNLGHLLLSIIKMWSNWEDDGYNSLSWPLWCIWESIWYTPIAFLIKVVKTMNCGHQLTCQLDHDILITGCCENSHNTSNWRKDLPITTPYFKSNALHAAAELPTWDRFQFSHFRIEQASDWFPFCSIFAGRNSSKLQNAKFDCYSNSRAC